MVAGAVMMRALYSLVVIAAQPFLRRKLEHRGLAEPGYLQMIEERFGRYDKPALPGAIWIHAVSLGETRAAAILIGEMRKLKPDVRILLTHGTATGRAEGERLVESVDNQAWLPWDTPQAVKRFLLHYQPVIGILMETEVWPNLVAAAHARGVPLVLANARMSEKSLAGTRRLAWLSRPAYQSLAAVWAQTDADARRLAQAGATVKGVLGNLKFDATPDGAMLDRGRHWRAASTRPVVMFASSREGEETQLLRAISVGNARDADVQWLIVPRHPQRFDEVTALIQQAGLSVSRRSQWGPQPVPANVWIGDSLGEMTLYYGIADVALLGGSFEPLGGQNLIEAAACGCPVVMGPHTFNFQEAAELAEAAGAALRVDGISSAVDRAVGLSLDPAQRGRVAAAALSFAASHRGAAGKTAAAVLALCPH